MLKYLSFLDTEPIVVKLTDGVSENGTPNIVVQYEGFGCYSEETKIVQDTDGKLTTLNGLVMIGGDIAPTLSKIEGSIAIKGIEWNIRKATRLRNPDGSVNHTELELNFELLWIGKCSVIERRQSQNPVNKRIEFSEAVIYENIACRLSYISANPTSESNNANEIKQRIKLLISPEINIPAGSKIIITQNGKTTQYAKSGEPAVFSNHQEIELELFKGWA